MFKQALIALLAATTLSGCALMDDSIFVNDAKPLNTENLSRYMEEKERPSPIEVDEAWARGADEVLLESRRAMITQYRQMESNWQFFSVPITLQKEMYHEEAQGFIVPINSLILNEIGAIESDFSITFDSAYNINWQNPEDKYRGAYLNGTLVDFLIFASLVESVEQRNDMAKLSAFPKSWTLTDELVANSELLYRQFDPKLRRKGRWKSYWSEAAPYQNVGYVFIPMTPEDAISGVEAKRQVDLIFRPIFATYTPIANQWLVLIDADRGAGVVDEKGTVIGRTLLYAADEGDLVWPKTDTTVPVFDHTVERLLIPHLDKCKMQYCR